jgi:acyl transferase domain-containing protein/SAM-dependent methyltransferase/acyl carrier protein
LTDAENLSPIKRALLEIRELRAQVDEYESARTEPIAIIGLGLRYPGDANTPEAFWQMLRDGVDAISEVPPERWNIDDFYDADMNAPGKMTTRGGGFIKNIDQFEPQFFGISPREAVSMDPQQRLLLEVTWEALENAGQSPDNLIESKTGVFVGMSTNDYGRLVASEIDNIDVYYATGNNYSVAAGRISYILGLQGPAVVVDTACSSSLVAVHLAAQSLRSRESSMAIAGGVNIILAPETNVNFSKAGMMAGDDRCKTFDADADGYVRSEGCGVVILKRLSEALNDGDHILALIRGTAINQDGRSSGLTAPNGPSQEAVIRAALENAGIEPADVDYVEAHGTGTPLGDPIEVRALAAVLSEGRPADRPLMIGAVKTNIGHTEAAAGVAGLIKLVLSLQHSEIPPHLHLQKLNPYIGWDKIPVVVPTTLTAWPAGDKKRIAGVSSFGFSGTNAHVIVEEAPNITDIDDVGAHGGAPAQRPLHLLTLSAKTADALTKQVQHMEAYLAENPDAAPGDVAFTLNAGRAHFAHRLALTANSTAQAREKLTAFLETLPPSPPLARGGESGEGLFTGQVETAAPEVAFLFSGQGAQYIQMGRELYETSPIFRDALNKCDEIAREYVSESLISVLYPETSNDDVGAHGDQRKSLRDGAPNTKSLFDQMTYAQPALFAVEYALATTWRAWGIEPTMVMGHSVGEYVAAVIAGMFSLEDGLKLVATRGRLMASLPGNGEMVAVLADENRVAQSLAPYADRVSIAAVNGPQNITISGDGATIATILAELKKERIHARKLAVTQASHSPMLNPILDEFEAVARTVTYYPAQIGLISGMTAQLITRTDAAYWRNHTRQAVQFSKAMVTLYDQGYRVFLEIGPSPTLLALGRRCVPEEGSLWLPSLREGWSDWTQMLESLAGLYVSGVNPNWNGVDRDFAQHKLPMPTYPWKRARYWVESTPQYQAAQKPVWDALVESGSRQAEQGPLDLGLQSYPLKWWHLNRLATAYIGRTFRQLGAYTQPRESYSLDELIEKFGIQQNYKPLMTRWLSLLAEENLLTENGGIYTNVAPLPEADFDALWQEAEDALADIQPLADYVVRCGDLLASVLTGTESAIGTLFPDGRYETVDFLYHSWALPRYYNSIVRAVIEKAASHGKKLRILEVGAGTGGTTGTVLPALPAERTVYHFTDVSDFFLGRAEERFAAYPFVRYGILNIENDPQAQGYAAGSFDVIIGANVLHATTDLNQTLQNVRSLLAPGGLLLVYEATDHPAWFDITVGLIEGWSLFEDNWRRDNPLLTPQIWGDALGANGFESGAAFPYAGAPSEILLHHVIVAQNTQDFSVDSRVVVDDIVGAHGRAPEREASTNPVTDADALLQKLNAALPSDRQDMLVEYVRGHVARILRINQTIERRQRLMDIGVDSLMAVELRSRLSVGANVTLPSTLIFDYPTVETIAEFLKRLLFQQTVNEPQAVQTEEVAAESTDVEGMSDDEVEALLLKKLKNM